MLHRIYRIHNEAGVPQEVLKERSTALQQVLEICALARNLSQLRSAKEAPLLQILQLWDHALRVVLYGVRHAGNFERNGCYLYCSLLFSATLIAAAAT